MTDAEVMKWIRDVVPHDENGRIIVSAEAVAVVERLYPRETSAHKYRLAQAETLLIAARQAGMEEAVSRLIHK
jgi:hypothetical protein